MAANLAPGLNAQFFTNQGVVLAGGLIYTYVAGTTTPATTWTDGTQATPNANPIMLDPGGRLTTGIYLAAGSQYKFILKTATGASVGIPMDYVAGINDVVNAVSQWVASGIPPTYISASSFSLPGDQSVNFQPGRRLLLVVTAGTVYGTISSVAVAGTTTVTVAMDSTGLDAGLSSVSYGLLSANNAAVPGLTAVYTTGGTGAAYTLTPAPALTAYVAGQSFFVNFNQASGASPTLAINGVATPPTLVKQNTDGTFTSIAAGDIPFGLRSRVTLISTTQALVENCPINQAWIDRTAFRALATTYTNNTGRAIEVTASTQSTAGAGATMSLFWTVNSTSNIAYTSNVVPTSVTQLTLCSTITVPAGATYSLTSTGGSPILILWAELR